MDETGGEGLHIRIALWARSKGLAQVLTTNGHPTSPNEAGRIQHEVLDLYTGLREWIRKTRERADRTGYLWTPQGRVYAPFKSNQLLPSRSIRRAKAVRLRSCFGSEQVPEFMGQHSGQVGSRGSR